MAMAARVSRGEPQSDVTSPQNLPLTLGDLLEQEDLGLTLATGPADALQRPLAGAHSVDLPNPGRWTYADWLVLSTGLQLEHDPDSAATLVAELVEARICALGFGLRPVFESVPESLLKAAEDAGLPVVTVPESTPFGVVIERVFRSALSEEVRASQRMVAMQRYLMDALGEDQPVASAIARLAELLHGQAALLTREGHVDQCVGRLPTEALWQAIADRPPALQEIDVEGRTYLAVPVPRRGGGVQRWLVVGGDPHGGSQGLSRVAAHAAVPLLTAIDQLAGVRRGQQRAVRGAMLDGLLSGRADRQLERQLRAAGFDGAGRATVAVVLAEQRDEALATLEDELDQAGVAFLADDREGRLVVLLQGEPAIVARLVQRLAERLELATIGVGGGVPLLDGAARSLREAQLAADSARAEGQLGVRDFGGLGVTTAILAEVDLDPVRLHADPLMRTLAQQPDAVHTLQVYFESDLSVPATAERLHLHPNSLRYRLQRIEQAVGSSIRSPATIAALYLALRSIRDDFGDGAG
jgi:purine catabolism regulator